MIFEPGTRRQAGAKARRRQAAAIQVPGVGGIGASALLLFCASALPLFCPACSSKSPEEKVREVVDACQKAAKEHKPAGVMEHIAQDFRDHGGNRRDMLKAILLREMMANRKLGIYITTSDVKVNGAEATANLKVVVTGSSGLIPERADGMTINLKLRDKDGKWEIYFAEWR